MKTQEELFNEWKEKCDRIKGLSGFFQNDIKRLYDEGYITLQDIQTSMNEFSELYTQAKMELDLLYCDVTKFHTDFIFSKIADVR
jgi:hypothetical protein